MPFTITMPPAEPCDPSVRPSAAACSVLERVLDTPEICKIISSYLHPSTVYVLHFSPPSESDETRSDRDLCDRVVGVYATKKAAEDVKADKELDGSLLKEEEEEGRLYIEELVIDQEPENTRTMDKKLRAKRHPQSFRMDRFPHGFPPIGSFADI
mmetsp:Transcript_23617/g.59294  ORF Transcript_23617/g.59294 Transcript_23617/m.59294 type:complete len:155 (-) Transcript_23617:264-728(-)